MRLEFPQASRLGPHDSQSRGLSRQSPRVRPSIDHSESPEAERKTSEPHQHEITLTTPLHLFVQVGDPRVELLLIMRPAAHAIADPRRQRLAAGDALSWRIVEFSFPGHAEPIEPQG